MGLLKGLFVAVYGSEGVIRTLFLPLCYFLLSTPFLLAISHYSELDSKLLAIVSLKDKNFTDLALQVFVGLIVFALPTRLISGKSWSSQDGGKRRVQQMPYWIPIVRHWWSIVLGGEGWFKKARESALAPIVGYNAAGAKHNVILSPPLLEQVDKESTGLVKEDVAEWDVLRNAFNMPKNSEVGYRELRPKLIKAMENSIFKKQASEKLLSSSLSILTESLPDLVTFNSSVVDQLQWERVANVELTDGTVEVECDLLSLINEFLCNAIIAPITGPQFPESYQLLASDLASVTELYYGLASGLPRLCPIPGLPGAILARKRLSQNFERFFNELEHPKQRVPADDESMSGEETDADTPTPMTAMNELFSKNEVPIEARAAMMLQFVHSIVSDVVPLAFWTLVHLNTSVAAQPKTSNAADTYIDEIRKECQIWVQATQPPSIHPAFPAPPEISYSGIPRLVAPTSFPRLRSAINEARRMYKASAKIFKISKSFTLNGQSIKPGVQEKWELQEGTYLDIGLSQTLTNTSPANFVSPNDYKVDRFKDASPPSSVASSSDPPEVLTTSLLVAFVAGVLQLWEIAPAPKKSFFDHMQEAQAAALAPMEEKSASAAPNASQKKVGEWVVPKAVDGAAVKIPKSDVRVRIRRREGLPPSRSLRKGR